MYKQELKALKRFNKERKRELYSEDIEDFASNDYLGLSTNKKNLQKAYNLVKKGRYNSPRSSIVINGYNKIHQKFENYLKSINGFEECLVVGSGFLGNIALIESLCRKGDTLFLDEEYHASGVLSSKIESIESIRFKHNSPIDLEERLKSHTFKRAIIAIEGVYSMSGDIASSHFAEIAKRYGAVLIVDDAHGSGVIGENLLGWFDYHHIKIEDNFIKLGTISKAYSSYGGYILCSNEIATFLVSRAKSIIYTTAPSIFCVSLALVNIKHIQKKRDYYRLNLQKRVSYFKKKLNIESKNSTPIVMIETKDTKELFALQDRLLKHNIIVGAIRPPTTKSPMLRVIIKSNSKLSTIKTIAKEIEKSLNA